MDNQQNNNNQVTFNYGHVMDMSNAEASDITREVISDTYAPHDGNEGEMLEQLDKMMTYMYEKRHGFVGYLSFCYAQMTMLYIFGKYSDAAKSIDMIEHGIDAVERFCFTGDYKDDNGNESGFTNFSCGEGADELNNTKMFAKDTFDTARLVHSKASSFESGYSLATAGIMYHLSINDTKAANEDCKSMRSICERIRKYLIGLGSDKIDDSSDAEKFSDFGNVEELKKENSNG